MHQADPQHDEPEDAPHALMASDPKVPAPRELSRLDRLKLKLKKLQGKNPDIYPMF